MAMCIYDNPNTWNREYWYNGELRQWFSGVAIMSKSWPSTTRKFEPGHIEGDPAAMKAAAQEKGVGRE